MIHMSRLAGKRILVTGGASGIGLATVRRYLDAGARVVMADLIEPRAESFGGEDAGTLQFIRFDAAREDTIVSLIDQSVEFLGGLEVLAQIAGIQVSGRIYSFDLDQFNRMVAVNVAAYFLGIKHALPHLVNAGGGSVINMASVAGKRGGAGMSVYSATKGAVIAMTASLARELAPRRIRVNAVCPGWVDTSFNGPAIANLGGPNAQLQAIRYSVPMQRQASPDEIAGMFEYLASDDSSFVTAQAFSIDGGVT
jgi:NAD(P)-dependent dehydrogenase (short-subunit alcohol dehydrogenase family)